MERILHQLRLVVYPAIYKVLYILGGAVQDFFHQQYQESIIFEPRFEEPKVHPDQTLCSSEFCS